MPRVTTKHENSSMTGRLGLHNHHTQVFPQLISLPPILDDRITRSDALLVNLGISIRTAIPVDRISPHSLYRCDLGGVGMSTRIRDYYPSPRRRTVRYFRAH